MTSLLRLLSRRFVQVILLLGMLAGAVLLWLGDPPALTRLRQMTFDSYNRLMPRPAFDDVRIVDIDESSIRLLGQWPWPRTMVGDIPLILREMGAKAVAFDIVFSEPDRTSPARVAKTLPDAPGMREAAAALSALPDNEAVFARKIREAGNVVTGFVNANQKTGVQPLAKADFFNTGFAPDPLKFLPAGSHYTVTLPELTGAAAGNGSFGLRAENDGVIRRIPLLVRGGDSLYPELPLEALRVAMGREVYQVESYGQRTARGYGIASVTLGDLKIPTDEAGNIPVYYAGHRPEIYVPAWKVLSRQVRPDTFKDKIVLVGTSAIGLLDLRSSPLDSILPGVEIHAEIIEQILHGQFLKRPGYFEGAEIVATVAVSLCVIFLAPFVGAGTLATLITVLIGTAVTGSLYVFRHHGLLIAPLYPSLTIILIYIVSSVLTNLRSEVERRQIRAAFGHYVSPALLEELTDDPSRLKLGGEVREMTVMFTDIRNFTSISEGMDPAELIRMMNDFLTPMTSRVMENRGTVDKYMGDAMMAFWNAPLDDPDHARHACRAALEMKTALSAVNAELKERLGGRHRELKAGIGLHTGPCAVGNMGSRQRFAYSALGDTVNLASRLEGQTKMYGVSSLISESTRTAAPDYAAIEVDLLAVKGRALPERVFTLLGGEEEAATPAFRDFAALHARVLEAYRQRKWDEALALGRQCLSLRPGLAPLYGLYATRISEYKAAPPPEGWTGVWVAKEK